MDLQATLSARDPKIIIIGAGIAGLASAQRITSNGFRNVLLLEASDRIGGRIYSTKFGHGIIDIGAQWIHGEENNVVYEFAVKHNLNDSSEDDAEFENLIFCTEDGLVIDNDLINRMSEAHQQAVDACRHAQSLASHKMSVDSFFDRAFAEKLSQCKNDEELRQCKALLQWFKSFQCSIEGCDSLADMSVQSFQQFMECKGKWLVNLKNGYSSVVNCIANELPPHVIQLNKRVVKIVSSPTGSSTSNEPMKIICEDGTDYVADHVIVAVSIGVLKASASTMFEPKLPTEKLAAIEKMGFGTVDKMFLEFERPFWPSSSSGYSLAWTSKQPVSSKAWYRGVFGFYELPLVPNVLCGWVCGAEARQMELLSDEEVKNTCIELLQRFTGIKDLPPVLSFLRSAWHKNPYVRGSYSYFRSQSGSNAPLAEPVYRKNGDKQYPLIMFAGEATHPHLFSTVNGAMETGWREADRLLNYFTSQGSKL